MLWSQPRLESMDLTNVNCGLRHNEFVEDLYRKPLKRVHFYACKFSGSTLEALVSIRATLCLTINCCWGENLSEELAPLASTLEEFTYKPSKSGSPFWELNLGSFTRLHSLALSPCAVLGVSTFQTLLHTWNPAADQVLTALQNRDFSLPPTVESLTIAFRWLGGHPSRTMRTAYSDRVDELSILLAAPAPLDSRDDSSWHQVFCDVLLDILPRWRQAPGHPGLQNLRLQLSKLPRSSANPPSPEACCPLAAAWRLKSWCAREGIRCDLHYEQQRHEFEWVWGGISDHADVDWHYSPTPWHYSTRRA